MPKCPKCGAEIDHLHHFGYYLQKADFWLNGKGEPNYDNWDDVGSMKEGTEEYRCPECDQVLFKNEDEAKKFLKSE